MAERLELAPDGSVGPTGRSYWIVEGRFAAGAYPGKAGRRELERVPEVIVAVLAAGIDTFVNLTQDYPGGTDEHLNHYDDDIDGAAVVKRFAIRDVSIPGVDLMVEVLDFIDDCLEHGRNPYVHCWGGIGRTGTVVGCWLIRHGYTDSDGVFDELARIRIGDLEAGHRDSPQVSEQWEFVRSWREDQ